MNRPARKAVRVLRRAARKTKRRIRRLSARTRRMTRNLQRRSLERYYESELREPLRPDLAVYSAYWYRAYSCNPRAVYEKARQLAPWIEGVWVVKEEHRDAIPAGVPYVVRGTRDYFRTLARATYFVNNGNWPNQVVKRPGTVHVHTHHGTPLKKMGMDLASTPTGGGRINFEALRRRVERWDYSVSSNAFSTEIWARAFPGDYEQLEIGYPRNDVMALAKPADVKRAHADLDIKPGQKVLLYAPTHREYEPDYVPPISLDRVAAGLGPDWVLLARAHYYDDPTELFGRAGGPGVRDVASYPVVEDLCLAADVLVTDYSSIMFDYGVLDRPIVVFAPDWEVYREMRGTYFDLLAEPPGAVARTEAELLDIMVSGRYDDAEATQRRASFRDRFCYLDDGGASERLVRRVFLDGDGGT